MAENQVKPKATILDLDAMLSTKMTDVKTIPDFVTPPPGLYVLSIFKCEIEKYDLKEDGKVVKKDGAQRIRITYQVKETVSHEGEEPPVANDSLFSETFTATEQGLEFFKKSAMNILGISDFEEATIKDIIDGIKDVSFRAKITMRLSNQTVNGKTQEFKNVVIRRADAVADSGEDS